MKALSDFILIIFLLSILTAGCRETTYSYSDIVQQKINNFDSGYYDYCNLDLTTNFELNAVRGSFYGDYRTALDQAAKDVPVTSQEFLIEGIDKSNQQQEIAMLEKALENPAIDAQQQAIIQQMLRILTEAPTEVFAEAKPVPAVQFITEQAKNYHFTLINEAHYNSQNRTFTQSLLKPLWGIGYRYLALEALGYEDDRLHERGYPISSTGFYIKDSNFGNLVREALALGYTLVTYEDQNGYEGTLRDRDQARNIYEQTWQKDTIGKVLVHAGYGHIFERGDIEYEPMGYQLKNLASQDVLTIDQKNMVGLPDSTKQHSYYQEALKKFDLANPTVFLDEKGEVIVDPIQSLGMDIQVYHPKTRYVRGRPDWMQRNNTRQVSLTAEFLQYEGSLIQAVPQGETKDAVPIDQFTISEEKIFLLEPGSYNIRIIDCEGDFVATSELNVY